MWSAETKTVAATFITDMQVIIPNSSWSTYTMCGLFHVESNKGRQKYVGQFYIKTERKKKWQKQEWLKVKWALI